MVALWLLFAATGVAAGFGATRLLEGPTARAAPADLAEREPQDRTTVTAPPPTGATTSPAGRQSGFPAPSSAPSLEATTSSPAPTPASAGFTLGIDTVAGYVSGTCASGVIRMSASPKPGWEVSELSPPGRMGEAEFEQTPEPGGEIGVNAWCEGGRPTFAVDDSELQPRANN